MKFRIKEVNFSTYKVVYPFALVLFFVFPNYSLSSPGLASTENVVKDFQNPGHPNSIFQMYEMSQKNKENNNKIEPKENLNKELKCGEFLHITWCYK